MIARQSWRLFVSLLSILLLGILGCPHTQNAKEIKLSHTHYLMGADLLQKKSPDGAKRELLKALKLHHENKDANHLLGVIFFMEGLQKINYMERDQCLVGVIAEEQRKEANKDFYRSEKYLKIAVSLAAKENIIASEGLNYLANVAIHFNRYDDAIAYSKKALENIVYSSRQLLLGTLGWAYFKKGDFTSAAREFRQAIFQQPKFCIGRYRLAKVYFENKEYDKVIEELTKFIDDKACPIQEAPQLLGLAYMKKKDRKKALAQFERCRQMNLKSCISKECSNYAKLM